MYNCLIITIIINTTINIENTIIKYKKINYIDYSLERNYFI